MPRLLIFWSVTFWSRALIYLSTLFFGHVYHFFLVALFGAGSIYPIYHVFQTCIPLFLPCSLWSRLYLPYLPCFSDMCTTFFGVALFGAVSIYPIYHIFSEKHTTFWLALFGAGSIYPIYHGFKIETYYFCTGTPFYSIYQDFKTYPYFFCPRNLKICWSSDSIHLYNLFSNSVPTFLCCSLRSWLFLPFLLGFYDIELPVAN